MPALPTPVPLQSAVRWQRFLSSGALGLAVILLGSALVCVVAANWPQLPVWLRLAGAQLLLAASAGAALLLGRGPQRQASCARRQAHRAALLLAGLVLGALLALVGQTYQTGADTWQLFAWWAALLLPWAWAGGTAVWLLWVLVANVALLFLLGERTQLGWLSVTGTPLAGLLLGAFNGFLLGIWEAVALARRLPGRTGPRVLAALAMAALTISVLLGGHAPAYWAAQLLIFVGLMAWYRGVRRDLVVLAIMMLGFMVMSLRVVGQWLWALFPSPTIALPLALLLLAEAVLAVHWLRRPGGLDPAATGPRRVHPWYAQALLAVSAWLASLLLLGFAVMSELFTEDSAWTVGLALCLAAALALRLLPARQLFLRQIAVAVAAGAAVLALAGSPWLVSQPTAAQCAGIFGLFAALYVAAPDRILRLLCGLAMGAACAAGFYFLHAETGWLNWLFEPSGSDPLRTRLVPVAILGWGAAAALLLAYAPGRPRAAFAPLGWAWMLAAQGYVWIAGGAPLTDLPALWSLYPPAVLASAALGLLPVLCLLLLTQADADGDADGEGEGGLGPGWRLGAGLGVLGLALMWTASPGVALALTWLLLGHGRARPHLAVFGVLAGLVYLLQYYYHLQVSLLDKSIWLAGAGALALALFILTAHAARRALRLAAPVDKSPRPRAVTHGWRAAVTAVGLIAALALVNTNIWLREQTLAQGQVLRLALAPVDPRAFMQGDYMALDYEVAVQMMQLRVPGAAPDAPFFEVPDDGYLILRADPYGVARLLRLQADAQPRADDEIALRYRKRGGRVQVATDAYFFPEGQAERYGAARYGEFRVNAFGTGLLVRLLDERLEPL